MLAAVVGTAAAGVDATTFDVVVIATVVTAAEAVAVPAGDAGSGRPVPMALRIASATALSVLRAPSRVRLVVDAERPAAVE